MGSSCPCPPFFFSQLPNFCTSIFQAPSKILEVKKKNKKTCYNFLFFLSIPTISNGLLFYSHNFCFVAVVWVRDLNFFSFMQYLLWNIIDQLYGFLHIKKKSIKFAIIYVHPNYCGQGSSISLPMIYGFIESLCMCGTYNLFSPHCIAFRVYHQKIWLGINQASKQASNIAL